MNHEDVLRLLGAGLNPSNLIEMLELIIESGGSAQDTNQMCEYIRADCSLSEIKLMLDLLDNKCMNKQLQAYFLECPKIKSDLKRFAKIEHEFNLL